MRRDACRSSLPRRTSQLVATCDQTPGLIDGLQVAVDRTSAHGFALRRKSFPAERTYQTQSFPAEKIYLNNRPLLGTKKRPHCHCLRRRQPDLSSAFSCNRRKMLGLIGFIAQLCCRWPGTIGQPRVPCPEAKHFMQRTL